MCHFYVVISSLPLSLVHGCFQCLENWTILSSCRYATWVCFDSCQGCSKPLYTWKNYYEALPPLQLLFRTFTWDHIIWWLYVVSGMEKSKEKKMLTFHCWKYKWWNQSIGGFFSMEYQWWIFKLWCPFWDDLWRTIPL